MKKEKRKKKKSKATEVLHHRDAVGFRVFGKSITFPEAASTQSCSHIILLFLVKHNMVMFLCTVKNESYISFGSVLKF